MAESPGGRALLDTSVVIALGDLPEERLPERAAISMLTLAELSAGPYAAGDELERARRQQHLQRFESALDTLEFDSDCARAFGPVYMATTTAGRRARGSRMIDLLIAATALAHRLPLYTQNAKDFRGLGQLIEIVDVSA